MVHCPVCEAERNIDASGICPQCNANLTPLLRLKALPESYYVDGVNLLDQGQIDEAIQKIITSLNLNPKNINAYLKLASLYMRKGWYKEAEVQNRKVLEIDPNNQASQKALIELKTIIQRAAKKEKTKRTLTIAYFGSAAIIVILLATIIIKTRSPQQSVTSSITSSATTIENTQKLDAPPTTLPKTEPEKQPIKVLYIIQPGDSLSKIAKKKYGTTEFWQKIYEMNQDKLKDPEELSVGQELILQEIVVQPKK